MILLLSNSTAFKLQYCFMQLVSWYKAAGSSTTHKDLQVCSIYVLFIEVKVKIRTVHPTLEAWTQAGAHITDIQLFYLL